MSYCYRFDNIKVLLMLLVITAHTLTNSYGYWGMEIIRFYCLCFTMPLFTFISGYLSKLEARLEKNVRHLLLPCVIFTIVNDCIRMIVDQNYTFTWKQPGFAMWYLWVLFVFRISLPLLVRIPHILPISFILSWLVGFIPFAGVDFSLQRIICFLPWFLLGYKFSKSKNLSTRLINAKGGGKWYMLLAACFAFWTAVIIVHPGLTYSTSFAVPYSGNNVLQLLLRISLQLTIAVISWCIIHIIPNKNVWYSRFGRNTMSVYLLHGIIVLPFAYLVFPPFADASILQRFLMVTIPVVCCLPLFTTKVNKILNLFIKV